MSYGADLRELFHRGAYYVDRVLKGAKPAELPVEQVSKVDLMSILWSLTGSRASFNAMVISPTRNGGVRDPGRAYQRNEALGQN